MNDAAVCPKSLVSGQQDEFLDFRLCNQHPTNGSRWHHGSKDTCRVCEVINGRLSKDSMASLSKFDGTSL